MQPSRSLDDRFPWTRVSNIALGAAVLFSFLSLARYRTFHNETFDLAFYARMVWGAGHLDLQNPMVGAPLWGLHLSWLIFPLGLLGRLVSIVPMLLVVQAACVASAGIPLARIAVRRTGYPIAADIALGVYLLTPTIASIATYEFHPSSIALLPLCIALDNFDRRDLTHGTLALTLAALCREDVALVAALVGLTLSLRREHRAVGLATFFFWTAYFVVYVFLIAPRFLPRTGSLQLHFGHLGGSPAGIVSSIFRHPLAVLLTLATPLRLLYVPRLLVPVAFTALLRPRWLLPALAPVAINLLSQFPTAPEVHSHYSPLAIPFVLVACAHSVGYLIVLGGRHGDRWAVGAMVSIALGSLWMQHRSGVLPVLGARFDPHAFVPDQRMEALDAVIEVIPPDASVSGPDYFLPHVAERPRLFRYPPPPRSVDYLVVSTEHRATYTGTQELWRNTEEQTVRAALNWDHYGVYAVVGPFIVLKLHWPVRTYARGRYVELDPDPRVHPAHLDIGPSLSIAGWGITPAQHGTHVVILLVPKLPWPSDLNFEVGWGPMVPHLDRQDPLHTYAFLPFDGAFQSPFVRVGEVVRTEVDIPATLDEIRTQGLYFGPRRIDGSRLDAHSPHWTLLSP